MGKKTEYSVTRIPDDDWNNLMETITLDGSYSEEIKNEVWTALEHTKDFSEPWVVVTIKSGKETAKIFNKDKPARKYAEMTRRKSQGDLLFCVKGQ
jgi:hypothetical protein